MSSMDGFLGKVVTDAVNNAVTSDRIGDGLKLIGQRQINIEQQTKISQDKQYIYELQSEIRKLKEENTILKENTYYNSNNEIDDLEDEYENLLSKPMHEIASKNKNFKKTYEEQQTILADWMVSQKAFKELAIQFGAQLGKTPDQVIEMGLDKKIDVLEDKNDPSHNTNVGDGSTIGPRKEALIDKYHKDKAARKAKKGS